MASIFTWVEGSGQSSHVQMPTRGIRVQYPAMCLHRLLAWWVFSAETIRILVTANQKADVSYRFRRSDNRQLMKHTGWYFPVEAFREAV